MNRMEDQREAYFRKKGWLKETGLTLDELATKMYRAAGACVCECGDEYREHPYADEARDQEGNPFLHVLCNGDIVKL